MAWYLTISSKVQERDPQEDIKHISQKEVIRRSAAIETESGYDKCNVFCKSGLHHLGSGVQPGMKNALFKFLLSCVRVSVCNGMQQISFLDLVSYF
jgi:hypothetical protein